LAADGDAVAFFASPNTTLQSAPPDTDRFSMLQVRERIVEEIAYELDPTPVPTKNKLVLAMMELCLLGICGVDRCYMGQTCLGLLKGISLGGLLIWFIVDWVVVMVVNYSFSESIQLAGFRGTFDSGIGASFWVTLVLTNATVVILLVKVFCRKDIEDPEQLEDYAMFDKEGSGYITQTMLKKVLLDNDVIISDEEVNSLFKDLDLENSGKISITELQKALLKK